MIGEVIIIGMILCLFLLLALGVPFAWACLTPAMIFGYLLQGPSIFPFVIFRTWDIINSFVLIAIPLFVLMANVLRYSGIAEDVFRIMHHWTGPLRGGLAVATVGVSTLLAAMVGIVGAGTTVMGLVALPAMLARSYDKGIAIGSILAGGALGVLIPPSITFILYAVATGLSVGKLFMGGVFPGLLLSGLYIAYIVVRCFLNPKLGPSLPPQERGSLRQKLALAGNLIVPVLLIMAVLGSIYAGIATPMEAAGVGVVGAIITAAVHGKLTWLNLKESLFDSMRTVGIVMWITVCAFAFVGVFSAAGGGAMVTDFMLELELGRWGTLAVIMLILFLLGMVFDTVALVILMAPTFAPIVQAFGFDPLWFGVLFSVCLQTAFLSPPFGYGIFYLKAVAPPEIAMADIYRAVWPFILLQLIGLTLVILFPPITLWLPEAMG